GLDLAKVGQQLLKAPLVVPHSRPRVVVFGHAAQEDLAVDGAGAARHLATRHQDWRRLVSASTDKLPIVTAGHDVDSGAVAVFDCFREWIEVRIVRSSLE